MVQRQSLSGSSPSLLLATKPFHHSARSWTLSRLSGPPQVFTGVWIFIWNLVFYALRSSLAFAPNDISVSRLAFGGGSYVHVRPWGGVSELFYYGTSVGKTRALITFLVVL